MRGEHPGRVLDLILRERGIRKRALAMEIGVYPQTLSNITKGARGMNTPLSLKLEEALGLEEGFFMVLQVYYDIARIRASRSDMPRIDRLRRVLFWDTDIDHIDWRRQYRAVIVRVFERGNPQEREEITRFYGRERVKEVLGHSEGTS